MPTTTPVIAAAEGRTVAFQGLTTRYVVAADATAGALAVVEHVLAPKALGAPTHTHEREDEISHVLAGRLGVQVGDVVVEAGPGDTVVKPRGVPHAFWNPGTEPVRFLELVTPGGFVDYFAEVEPILSVAGPPDVEALGAVMARFGLSMDPASLPRLVAEHGLQGPPA